MGRVSKRRCSIRRHTWNSSTRSHPLTTNDLKLTERLVPSLHRVVGKENVTVVPPETGAEDFSFFSNIVPGFYFKLGVVPEGKASGGHHTPTFYADDKAVPIGIRALSTLVLDYLAAGQR